MKRTIKLLSVIALLLALCLTFTSCDVLVDILNQVLGTEDGPEYAVSLDDVPEFDGYPYVIINNGVPFFTEDEIVTEAYESYAALDGLGRCGVTIACIDRGLMPTEKRGSIGMVKPSGWQTIKFDIVDGKYLYNRCHLIGFQLTGENANKENLITGTRFMNVDGMLPFEDMVADHIKEEGGHVMYRVTPIYKGNEPLARGVLMEAYSVEDKGEGVEFCVYVYNNQPGVRINYADGTAKLDDGIPFPEGDITLPGGETVVKPQDKPEDVKTYMVNTNTDKYHKLDCTYADQNKYAVEEFSGTKEDLLEAGFDPCGTCKPHIEE